MSGRVTTFAALALVLAIVVSGCVFPSGPDGRPFDALEAPRWEAGYSWTYRQVDSVEESFAYDGRDETRTSTNTVTYTLRVTNTTQPVGARPAYFVVSDQPLSSLLFGAMGAEAFAVAQEHLSVVAASPGYYYGSPYGGGGPMVMELDYASPSHGPPPAFECDASPTVTPIKDSQAFPTLRFPLDEGDVFSGVYHPVGGPKMSYDATVDGLRDVKVGAGDFEAVHVTVKFVGTGSSEGPYATPAGPYDGTPQPVAPAAMPGFGMEAEHWYAPQAGYLVKSLITVWGSYGGYGYGGPESFKFVSEVTLLDASLTGGPEEPAPAVIAAGDAPDYKEFEIVADRALPANAADGPVDVRFGLEERLQWEEYGQVRAVESVSEQAPIDHSTHRVVWTLWSYYGSSPVYHVGDAFDATLESAGHYSVSAEVRSIRCSGPWAGSGHASFAMLWQKVQDVSPGVGPGKQMDVFEFPVEAPASQVTITVTDRALGQGMPDPAMPVVVDPEGQVAPLESLGADAWRFTPERPGMWTLAWDTGTMTLLDDATVDLLVDYEDYGYCCYYL